MVRAEAIITALCQAKAEVTFTYGVVLAVLKITMAHPNHLWHLLHHSHIHILWLMRHLDWCSAIVTESSLLSKLSLAHVALSYQIGCLCSLHF